MGACVRGWLAAWVAGWVGGWVGGLVRAGVCVCVCNPVCKRLPFHVLICTEDRAAGCMLDWHQRIRGQCIFEQVGTPTCATASFNSVKLGSVHL